MLINLFPFGRWHTFLKGAMFKSITIYYVPVPPMAVSTSTVHRGELT